jgi:ribosome-associated protein
MDDLPVSADLVIPGDELAVRFSRSGGPGGQHVNTSATRVELVWNVAASRALDERQRELVLDRLASRIDGEGNVRVVVDTTRSQLENRARAGRRLATIVAAALRPRRARQPTTPTAQSRARRLDAKRRRGETKRLRQPPPE